MIDEIGIDETTNSKIFILPFQKICRNFLCSVFRCIFDERISRIYNITFCDWAGKKYLFSTVVYISCDRYTSVKACTFCFVVSGTTKWWQTSWKLLKIVSSNAWNAPRLLKLRIGNIFAIYRLRIDAWIKKKKTLLSVAKMIDLLLKKKKKIERDSIVS